MKKIPLLLLIFWIFICIFFSGCENQINRTFDGNVIGKHTILCDNDNQFIVNVKENEIVITVNSGDYNGLSYKFTNSGYEINYNDLVCKSNELYISKNSLIAIIAETFFDMVDKKSYIGLSEYNPYISGNYSGGSYKVIFDEKEGKIISIIFTGINTEIKFLYS